MTKKLLFRYLKLLALLYGIIGIAFYYLQNRILLHPEPIAADSSYAFQVPHRELRIPETETSVISIVQFLLPDSASPRGVVLYFHGNRDHIGRYAPIAPVFTQEGYEIWMIDYPGFGKSTGSFTEQKVYDWALQLYKLARARFAPSAILIYGKSLGTGPACQLASIRDCRHLILEAPYYDFPSLVRRYLPVYPLNRLMHYHFPNWQWLPKVDAPVTIFHGTEDAIIPLSNAAGLKPLLKNGSTFITVKGASHNNLLEFAEVRGALKKILQP